MIKEGNLLQTMSAAGSKKSLRIFQNLHVGKKFSDWVSVSSKVVGYDEEYLE